ncbi:MAG: hypothetical protein LBU10_04645 [Endomicrobium sp.]|nr:hypothetical protein [Endomicrobium sp.]
MSNLINNGVEAVEESYEVKGGKVEILVKDNGNGMSKGVEDKIYPFV